MTKMVSTVAALRNRVLIVVPPLARAPSRIRGDRTSTRDNLRTKNARQKLEEVRTKARMDRDNTPTGAVFGNRKLVEIRSSPSRQTIRFHSAAPVSEISTWRADAKEDDHTVRR